MHEVVLTAVPAARAEHVERVVHKHNRTLTHQQHEAMVKAVIGGGSEVVARYVEEHAAHNVVKELAYHGATAEVRSA